MSRGGIFYPGPRGFFRHEETRQGRREKRGEKRGEKRRKERREERERSGERKPLVTGDANLTIMLRWVP